MTTPLLSIKNLSVVFKQGEQILFAVKNATLELNKGETLALVGESGSRKSVTAYSILRLLPKSGSIPEGKIEFEDQNLLKLSENQIRGLRGNKIGMIFQEPMSSLNPLHTIEKQIKEVLLVHQGLDQKQSSEKTLNENDLENVNNSIIKAVESKTGAKIRS